MVQPLERAMADQMLYPAVDPLASSSRILDPRVVGDEHYAVAQQVQEILQRYRDGGLSDAKMFNKADGLSWKTGAGVRNGGAATEWHGKRSQAGRVVPRGFPKGNNFG